MKPIFLFAGLRKRPALARTHSLLWFGLAWSCTMSRWWLWHTHHSCVVVAVSERSHFLVPIYIDNLLTTFVTASVNGRVFFFCSFLFCRPERILCTCFVVLPHGTHARISIERPHWSLINICLFDFFAAASPKNVHGTLCHYDPSSMRVAMRALAQTQFSNLEINDNWIFRI